MATAELIADPWGFTRGRDRHAARLIAYLARPDPRGRPVASWIPSDRALKGLACKPVQLAAAIRRGAESGMISTATRSNGRLWLRLTALAGTLLGVAVPEGGPPVDARGLDAGPHEASVLAVVGSGSTCPAVEPMAARLGRDVDELWGELLSAERDGMVETWADHPAGPSVTLSPLAAQRLQLSVSLDGSRWLRPGQFDPTTVDPECREVAETDASGPHDDRRRFDDLADPDAPEGLAVLVAREEDAPKWAALGEETALAAAAPPMPEKWRASDDDRTNRKTPKVQLTIGVGLPWPVWALGVEPRRPWRPKDGPCPACHGRALAMTAYCLVCDAAGAARLLEPAAAIPEPGRKAPKGDRLRGGV